MSSDPLESAILDLDHELDGDLDFLVGGGYGLYLKQRYLAERPQKTLIPLRDLPIARTTQDIDLFLRAEVVTDSRRMKRLRRAIDALGFFPIEGARFYQFARETRAGAVKLDLLAGPLGQHENRVKPDVRRVRPRPSAKLHAHRSPEALGLEYEPLSIRMAGPRSDGTPHSCKVLIPQALPYTLMKLMALRDRINDRDKDQGRHHALDLYRIVGMLTEHEDVCAALLRGKMATDPVLDEARDIVHDLFGARDGVGRLRMREHVLLPSHVNLDRFTEELERLVGSE